MIRRVFVLVLALAATRAGAADPVAQDFAYGQPIVTTETATGYRVALPIELYRAAVREDLGDLFGGQFQRGQR